MVDDDGAVVNAGADVMGDDRGRSVGTPVFAPSATPISTPPTWPTPGGAAGVGVPAGPRRGAHGGRHRQCRASRPSRRAGVGWTSSTDVVVVDDGSSDATATAAQEPEPRVVRSAGVGEGRGHGRGLGPRPTASARVPRRRRRELRAPLRHRASRPAARTARSDVALVKGFYERPLFDEPRRRAGDRARGPAVIAVLFPDLSTCANRWRARPPRPGPCSTRPAWPPATGSSWACSSTWPSTSGSSRSAQVDLGVRVHRNRPLSELRPQATDVLRAALARAPSTGRD